MFWRWEGSTTPLETPWHTIMGWSLPPSKIQNYKIEASISPHLRDRDQDRNSEYNCAQDYMYTGGWWYDDCTFAHLTGIHTERKEELDDDHQIFYLYGGERGRRFRRRGRSSHESWSEVEMLLLSNWALLPSLFFILSVQGCYNRKLWLNTIKQDLPNISFWVWALTS